MKAHQQSIRTTARNAALVVIFASSVVATMPAQAGWFSNIGSKVHKVTARVAAAPGNLESKVKDISAKLNEMFQKFEDGRPLLQKMQNIHAKETLMEVVDYLRDSREDYDQFSSNESEHFRGNLQDIFSNLAQINQTMLHNDALQARFDKANRMLDKLPVSFLYIMHKAIGAQLEDMQDKLTLLQTNLAPYANMPRMVDVMQAPRGFSNQICDLHENYKVRRAVIKVILGQLSVIADAFQNVVPHDLVVEADVVGEGGGLTWSSHPLNWIASLLDLVVNMTKEGVDDYDTIAEAICPATN